MIYIYIIYMYILEHVQVVSHSQCFLSNIVAATDEFHSYQPPSVTHNGLRSSWNLNAMSSATLQQ